MIVYVTPAEKNGGILQFSITMLRETLKLEDALLFLPDSAPTDSLPDIRQKIISYSKVKTVNGKSEKIKKLASEIAAQMPRKIIFLEDSILMQQLNAILSKNGLSTALVIHDVIRHPYHNMSVRQIAVDFLRQHQLKKTVHTPCTILLLSQNSKNIFEKRFSKHRASIAVMRLGAHIPDAQLLPVHTIESSESYLLFFGRVDKYKGIENLCRAYSMLKQEQKERLKLVIAGNGVFSEEEEELIRKNPTIRKIHRFIEDGEMLWLIKNAKAVVLPYIEASQSGVLPISYHFGKPVVVSNLPGLTENVENGKTAAIYDTVEQLADIIAGFSDDRLSFDSEQIYEYYHKNFNWEMNVTKLLEQIL